MGETEFYDKRNTEDLECMLKKLRMVELLVGNQKKKLKLCIMQGERGSYYTQKYTSNQQIKDSMVMSRRLLQEVSGHLDGHTLSSKVQSYCRTHNKLTDVRK